LWAEPTEDRRISHLEFVPIQRCVRCKSGMSGPSAAPVLVNRALTPE
jgi:hypothetical protein